MYRGVVVSARYTPAITATDDLASSPALVAAVTSLVMDNQMLRVGIINGDNKGARFTHIPQIDLSKHISFLTVPCASMKEYQAVIGNKHGELTDEVFENLASTPPWKIVLTKPHSTSPNFTAPDVQDILFSYHHSILDGMAGRHVQEALISYFTDQDDVNEDLPLVLENLEIPNLPNPEEIAVPFTLSPSYIVSTLWGEFGPTFLKAAPADIWYGEPVNRSLPFTTNVRCIEMPAAMLQTLLAACKEHSTSLTALLHVLILSSIAKQLPDAPGLSTATPISMRPYVTDGAPETTFRCLTTGFSYHFSPATLATFKAGATDGDIWEAAKQFRDKLSKKVASLPADDITAMMKYIPDWRAFWEKKDGKARPDSWEISNIGILRVPKKPGKWSVISALFSGSCMVAGGPFCLNALTVAGGGMTIAMTWQRDIVPVEMIEKLREDLTASFQSFVDSKTFI